MKSNEEYLEDYFNKKNELSRKGEQWRLRVTQEEFVNEIERIRADGIKAREMNYLTEYHIRRNEEAGVELLLKELMTKEEFIAQCSKLEEESAKLRANEAPEIRKEINLIQTPLGFGEIVFIFNALWYKQITFEMLSEPVFNEFKETAHYHRILRRNEEESI